MNKKKLTIAVSGLNAIDSPGPGVAVIRALREAAAFDCRIIGLAYESLEPGIFMHHLVDKSYMIPYPSAGTEAVFERLEYIHEQENLQVVIPNFDAELYPFIRLEKRLADLGIATFLPTEAQFEERLKVNLPEFGEKYGFNVPHSQVFHDLHELKDLQKNFEYPVLVKGKYYDAYVAYNMEQAKSFFTPYSGQMGGACYSAGICSWYRVQCYRLRRWRRKHACCRAHAQTIYHR
jgi:carbamoyl-phosphate synthase large subunit